MNAFMKRLPHRPFALVAALLALLSLSVNVWAQVVVGRITVADGDVLRYVPEQEDWVPTVRDAPFGLDDTLYTDEKARAEIIMPNNAWVRLGGATQVQLIGATPDALEVDVASGMARIYNKGNQAVVKATTPFGYVVAQPDSSFDLYVGDNAAEVIALTGVVDFVDAMDTNNYEVLPGGNSVIADEREVGSGDGMVDGDWDDWNRRRDDYWQERLASPSESIRRLPPELATDAYDLDRHGSWERIVFDGEEQDLWRPRYVSDDWEPFTTGRWTDWNGDNTWIPDEEFGYTTHHYGNWVHVHNHWYWAPPRRTIHNVYWYPGRVAWIDSDDEVGWVPLAPHERYYAHRPWGPDVVVGAVAAGIVVAATLHNLHHAVIVPRHNLYHVRNYAPLRVRQVDRTTIINRYKVVNNTTIINNYRNDRQRVAFTDRQAQVKPHRSVNERIRRNQQIANDPNRRFDAQEVRKDLVRTRDAAPRQDRKVAAPLLTNKMVAADQVDRPAQEVKFSQRNAKNNPAQTQVRKRDSGATTGDDTTRRRRQGGEAAGVQGGDATGTDGVDRTDRRNWRQRDAQGQEGPRTPRQNREAGQNEAATGTEGADRTDRRNWRQRDAQGQEGPRTPRQNREAGQGGPQAPISGPRSPRNQTGTEEGGQWRQRRQAEPQDGTQDPVQRRRQPADDQQPQDRRRPQDSQGLTPEQQQQRRERRQDPNAPQGSTWQRRQPADDQQPQDRRRPYESQGLTPEQQQRRERRQDPNAPQDPTSQRRQQGGDSATSTTGNSERRRPRDAEGFQSQTQDWRRSQGVQDPAQVQQRRQRGPAEGQPQEGATQRGGQPNAQSAEQARAQEQRRQLQEQRRQAREQMGQQQLQEQRRQAREQARQQQMQQQRQQQQYQQARPQQSAPAQQRPAVPTYQQPKPQPAQPTAQPAQPAQPAVQPAQPAQPAQQRQSIRVYCTQNPTDPACQR